MALALYSSVVIAYPFSPPIFSQKNEFQVKPIVCALIHAQKKNT